LKQELYDSVNSTHVYNSLTVSVTLQFSSFVQMITPQIRMLFHQNVLARTDPNSK